MNQQLRTPFLVTCKACSHVWPAVWLPMEAEKFAKATKRTVCPMCATSGKGIVLSSAEDERKYYGEPPVRTDGSVMGRAHSWIAGRDTGTSSKAIWAVMMGNKPERDSQPWDPDDLGRCLRLLDLIPEWKPRIVEMSKVSPRWAALVARWDEVAQAMTDEVGIDWSKGRRAPKTYNLMKEVLGA